MSSKPDFDLDLFWSLPRCTGVLTNGEGSYCAIGAMGKALGYSDEVLRRRGYVIAHTFLGDSVRDIHFMNDTGNLPRERIGPGPNHERAKRMVLEALEGKVNFISKPVSLPAEASACD